LSVLYVVRRTIHSIMTNSLDPSDVIANFIVTRPCFVTHKIVSVNSTNSRDIYIDKIRNVFVQEGHITLKLLLIRYKERRYNSCVLLAWEIMQKSGRKTRLCLSKKDILSHTLWSVAGLYSKFFLDFTP
jgi:hypothetical protein